MRLVPRRHGSSAGSRGGTSETESLPPSSPRDVGSPNLSTIGNSSPPQNFLSSPTTTLPHPLTPIEEWRNNWGQVSQNAGYQYSMYPANPTSPTNPANPQWTGAMDASAASWYGAQPIQFHDPTPIPVQHHQVLQHHQQPQYMNVDVAMGNAFPSFGQTSVTLNGEMSPYDYSPPPQNNGQAHWQHLFVEMGANYP